MSLRQQAAHAELRRFGDLCRSQFGGEQDCPRSQAAIAQLVQHRPAVEPRHSDVEHQDVGTVLFHRKQRRPPVGAAGEHLDVALAGEQRPSPLSTSGWSSASTSVMGKATPPCGSGHALLAQPCRSVQGAAAGAA